MDNMEIASCDYQIYFDRELSNLGDLQQPHSHTFLLQLNLARFIVLTAPETTSQLGLVPLSLEEQTWAIPFQDLSPEFISFAVSHMRLTPYISTFLVADLSFHAHSLANDTLFGREAATVAIGVLITAIIPQLYDEALHIERASNESFEEVFEDGVGIPASEAAIAGLKEVSLETDELIDDSSCMVCLEELVCLEESEGDVCEEHRVAVRLPCSHVYHKDCIVRWLKSSHSCPLCRYALPTEFED